MLLSGGVKNLQAAAELLRQGPYTCILCRQGRFLTSEKRGIVPLLCWLEEDRLKGSCVADKIIGKAAALLLILGGAEAVHGEVMTRTAYALLREKGLSVSYGELTETIVNRKGDGPCPMELAVKNLEDPALAPAALRAALEGLQNKN